jgi:hypothetical protein
MMNDDKKKKPSFAYDDGDLFSCSFRSESAAAMFELLYDDHCPFAQAHHDWQHQHQAVERTTAP